MLKRIFVLCIALLLSDLYARADSTFVDAGIRYKVICADSVSVVAPKDGYQGVAFQDSVLHVPASVRYGDKSFYVRSIEHAAFATCSGIKRVVIDNGIEKIGKYAFEACVNMESVSIPASVKDIGNGVFRFCI